jgi:RHS repeat-associated protein
MLRRAMLLVVIACLTIVSQSAFSNPPQPISFWNVTNWNQAYGAWLYVRYSNGDSAIRAQFTANNAQCSGGGGTGWQLADTYPVVSGYPYNSDGLYNFDANAINCATGQTTGTYPGGNSARQYIHCPGQSDTYWTYDEADLWQDMYGSSGKTGCQSGFYIHAPTPPNPNGNCNNKPGCSSTGEPIDVATGNVYLSETDYTSADQRLQFTRVYNSFGAFNQTTTVGNGWQGELDARHILSMDAGLSPVEVLATYGENSTTFSNPNDACVQGWAQIANNGGTTGNVDPQWKGITATYDGVGHCNLSNGQSVPVLGTDTSEGLVGTVDYISRGVTVRRGDGELFYAYCYQGVCTMPGTNSKIKMKLDTTGYTITDEGGNAEHYDYLGFLSTITYKDGYQLSFVYNNDNAGNGYLNGGDGTPLSITDNHGRSITFTYGSDTMLATVTGSDGTVIRYNHDAGGRLVSVIYPTGTRTYNYNSTATLPNEPLLTGSNALLNLVDENNNTLTTWTYDSTGRATSSVNAGSTGSATLLYNPDGTVTVTDALGTKRTYGFQNAVSYPQTLSVSGLFCSTCGPGKLSTYDGNGFLASSTDWNNNLTKYTFSPNGLLDQLVEGAGSPVQRTTSIQWDTTLINPLTWTIQDVDNNLVAQSTWAYNSAGEPLAQCQADPKVTGATGYTCSNTGTAPAGVRRWTYTYCTTVSAQCPLLDLLLTATDPDNNVTYYSYYQTTPSTCPTTCPYRAGDLEGIRRPLNNVTAIIAYDGAGRPLSFTDPNGVETDVTYTPRGWLASAAVRNTGNSTIGEHITHYAYDNVGNLTLITRPDNSTISLKYDPAHRLTDVTDNLGDTIHYTLDAVGNRTQEATKDPSGNLKRNLVRQFNALGQLAKTINADGATVNGNYAYDTNGNPNVLTDGLGIVTNNTFDALNRINTIVQDPGSAPHVAAYTTLTLDALDRTANVNDPHGLNTQYQYDGLNDVIQLTSPDTGVTTATYDAAGNVLTRTDARSVTATYSYDALNRVTSIKYPTSSLNRSFTYDTTQNSCTTSTQTFSIGRLTAVSDASGTTQFCYDRFGNMAQKQQVINGTVFTTSYTFDAVGRVTQVTTPSGTNVQYTRDAVGRVAGVSYELSGQTSFTPLVKGVTYYPFGPVASITYNDGRVLNRTYDQDYVISGVTDSGAGGLNLTFGRDILGHLNQVNNSTTTGNKFVYDDLYRLTGVNDLSSNPIWTYTYDATGNRLSKQHLAQPAVGYAYPATAPLSHQLQAVGNTPRGYDAIGDTASIGTGSGALDFVFDNTGRMSQLNNGSGATQMQYATNAFGQRVEKYLTGNTALTQFTVDDEAGHPLGDYNSTGGRIRETIWMDGMPVGVLNGTAGSLTYLEPDQIGTPRVGVDGTSNVATWNWSQVNDPFGETQPTNLNGSSLALNLRMPGQSYDAESGLNYNYFRDYDPTTGRYIESDPLGLRGGISTYSYGRGSPLRFSDPYGLWTLSFGGTISFSFGAFNISLSGGFVVDGHGNFGTVSTFGGLPGIATPGASAGPTLGWSNADTINDLSGPFKSATGGVAAGDWQGSVTVFHGTDNTPCHHGITGVEFSLAPSLGLPGPTIVSGTTDTTVVPIN